MQLTSFLLIHFELIGLAGHEFHKHGHDGHHYSRDGALAGGVLEHEHHKHENKYADDVAKPSIGDKINGGIEKAVGKATGNENKVIEGDILAHGYQANVK